MGSFLSRLILAAACLLSLSVALANDDRFELRFQIARRFHPADESWTTLSLRDSTFKLKPSATSRLAAISLKTDGCAATGVQKILRDIHATENRGLTLTDTDLKIFGGVRVEENENGKLVARNYDEQTPRAKLFKSLYTQMLALQADERTPCGTAVSK